MQTTMNKIRTLMLAAVSVVCTTVVAQKSITEKTYWIDGDVGNAQVVASSIDISSLSAGVHSLTIRVKDSENLWSPSLTKYFVIPSIATTATNIANREYWIDGNIASRTSHGASPADINLMELAAGVHSLTIRVKDDNGIWSPSVTKYFIVPHIAAAATDIEEREYWIDGNIATRTFLGASPAEISLVELAAGMHSLTIRMKDDNGIWSPPLTKYFIVPNATELEEMKIARYMYWIDDDNNNAVTATADNASSVLDIDIGELADGEHVLSWCVADTKGVWSDVKTASFTFTRTPITSSMIALSQSSFEYAAEEIKPGITVVDGDKLLVEGEDYEVSYTNNTNTGDATVTVTGKGIYKESVDVQFAITKATLTVTAENKKRKYGDENPELTLSYSGWKGLDDASVLTTPPMAITEATAKSTVGEYLISVSGGEAANYVMANTAGTLTIEKATLKVGVADVSMTAGEQLPVFSLTYEGFKNDEDETVLTTLPQVTTDATSSSVPGDYVLTVSGGEATNYTFIYTNGTLTIEVPSGIQQISADRPVNVYTLGGVLVRRDATTLDGLSDGVYIINGKKVYVRRKR